MNIIKVIGTKMEIDPPLVWDFHARNFRFYEQAKPYYYKIVYDNRQNLFLYA